MKERLLVLAKAAPEASKKYQALICVAGITDKGEWRRIYPIPWEAFWSTSENRFSKKHWIEYEVESEEPSDHRPESRKIKFDTVKTLRRANYSEIVELLEERAKSIEELEKEGHRTTSLGIVKPTQIMDFKRVSNKHYEKLVSRKAQQTLGGKPALQLDIPQFKHAYKFTDCAGCRTHEMICEDWEVAELYRKCEDYRREGRYKDEEEVFQKVRQKMFDWLKKKPNIYFIVGTHYRFPSYLIIGVVYPTKQELMELKNTGIDP